MLTLWIRLWLFDVQQTTGIERQRMFHSVAKVQDGTDGSH
jgi:hypothetical protein